MYHTLAAEYIPRFGWLSYITTWLLLEIPNYKCEKINNYLLLWKPNYSINNYTLCYLSNLFSKFLRWRNSLWKRWTFISNFIKIESYCTFNMSTIIIIKIMLIILVISKACETGSARNWNYLIHSLDQITIHYRYRNHRGTGGIYPSSNNMATWPNSKRNP